TTPTNGSTKHVTSGGVYNALATKQNNLTFDGAPVNGSGNPVTSGGVYSALHMTGRALAHGYLHGTGYTASGLFVQLSLGISYTWCQISGIIIPLAASNTHIIVSRMYQSDATHIIIAGITVASDNSGTITDIELSSTGTAKYAVSLCW
ncbi:MAG: hypothetical protein WC900_05555, partial [Oscillospiraceae bacterium]